MQIGILKETVKGENRVAATPDTVKEYVKLGLDVAVEKGAGKTSGIADETFKAAGASLSSASDILKSSDILLKVQPPSAKELGAVKPGTLVIGLLGGLQANAKALAKAKVSALSMELIPRISRAQSMDALSSQANLAGYKAVIDAVSLLNKAVPLMMTAAGRVVPANVLILGAGVAGLQAIATAKRLGAVVSAFDVRPAVKEQVQSLGAKFIEVADDAAQSAETSGGYAKEMSKEYQAKQQALIHETLRTQDIVITTALIPGKPAPVLITEAMVKDMKHGAIIVDMAVSAGGNCPLSKCGDIVEEHGVTLVGYDNLPSRVAIDASRLYAKNLLNLVALLISKDKKSIQLNMEDEIIKGALLLEKGNAVHPAFTKGSLL